MFTKFIIATAMLFTITGAGAQGIESASAADVQIAVSAPAANTVGAIG